MGRRYDPERRQRIIDAAIRVVGEKGIAGLSHRSVAAEADVPLGSTTYHFSTLDELLVAALRQANEGFAKVVASRGGLRGHVGQVGHADHADHVGQVAQGGRVGQVDLAGELAGLLGEWLSGDRAGVELECELYLAALRRPALRSVAAEWADGVVELLGARTDAVTARALVAVMDGICLRVLLTGDAYEEEFAREVFGRVLRG